MRLHRRKFNHSERATVVACWVCHKPVGDHDWMSVNGVPEHYRCIGVSSETSRRKCDAAAKVLGAQANIA